MSAADYILGYSAHEYERLTLQGRILRPYTERFFRMAGLTPGMRVLDCGAGMGDVSMLAGDITGPGGRVLGVDRDAAVLENAKRRAAQNGCGSWVSFAAAELGDFEPGEMFDALTGRLVLLYQPDPAATLRSLLRFVRPGGIVVFHEMDFTETHPTYPPSPLFDGTMAGISGMFRKAGFAPDFGRRLAKTFTDAGLPFPAMAVEAVVGGGPGSPVYQWAANTLLSLAPRMGALGYALPEGFTADETLAKRIESEAVAAGSQVLAPVQFGAWTRKP